MLPHSYQPVVKRSIATIVCKVTTGFNRHLTMLIREELLEHIKYCTVYKLISPNSLISEYQYKYMYLFAKKRRLGGSYDFLVLTLLCIKALEMLYTCRYKHNKGTT